MEVDDARIGVLVIALKPAAEQIIYKDDAIKLQYI